NGSAVNGATTNTLTIPNAQTGDSGNYTVTISNQVGTVSSTVAVLAVNPLPAISVPSASYCTGGSATLNAATTAANPIFLWTPGGATNASITVSPASTTIYTVTVRDGITGCSNSASATVTVNPLTVASPLPSFTNACVGSVVTFSTSASG